NRWLAIEHVQQLISRGLHAAAPIPSTRPSPDVLAEADAVIDTLRETSPWDSVPLYVLQAIPSEGLEPLTNLYDRTSPFGALQDPQPIRDNGFNFGYWNEPVPVENGIEVGRGERHLLRLD